MQDALLQLRSVTKSFPGVVAVDNLDLDLRSGQIHALVGGNGSGKSTTVGMLSGNSQPNKGEIVLRGKEVTLKSPRHAKQQGIVTIFQERQVFPDLTVAENIFLDGFSRGSINQIAWRDTHARAQELLDTFGVGINGRKLISHYGVGIHQIVEIIRGMVLEPALLILDEPTASLSRTEVEMLFSFLRRLKTENVAVLLIVHNLEEVLEIADVVSVLRDSRKVAAELDAGTVSKTEVITHMLGAEVGALAQGDNEAAKVGTTLIEARDIPVSSWGTRASLQINRGEILSIIGLMGSGASDVAGVLSGAMPPLQADVRKKGKPVKLGSVRRAVRQQIASLPPDRKKMGLFFNLDVKENTYASILVKFARSLFYNIRHVSQVALQLIGKTNTKPTDPHARIKNLSGGNQQKVLFSRILALEPEVMILQNPTAGVDVGAQREIHNLIAEQARAGVGVLLITGDLFEAAVLSDRVLIMRNGKLTDELTQKPFRETELLALASDATLVRNDSDDD